MKLFYRSVTCFLFWGLVFIMRIWLRGVSEGSIYDIYDFHDIKESNISSKSVTISWTTAEAYQGKVGYTNNPDDPNSIVFGFDLRDSHYCGYTHYVKLSSLSGKTTYAYWIYAGKDITDQNSLIKKGPFFFTTTLQYNGMPPLPEVVCMHVFKTDGITPAENAMIFLKIRHSNGEESLLGSGSVASSGCGCVVYNHLRDPKTLDFFPHLPGDTFIYNVDDGKEGNYFSYEWKSEVDLPGSDAKVILYPCKNSYYLDADSDGFGDPNMATQGCCLPLRYVLNSLDCNDRDSIINPGNIDIKAIKAQQPDGSLSGNFAYGRNVVTLDSSCYPYTSFDFLFYFRELGDSLVLQHRDTFSGQVRATYWLFDQVCGEEIEFPEDDSDPEEALYVIDKQ